MILCQQNNKLPKHVFRAHKGLKGHGQPHTFTSEPTCQGKAIKPETHPVLLAANTFTLPGWL